MFRTESDHKGEGSQKTPNLDYVIHGWSLSKCHKRKGSQKTLNFDYVIHEWSLSKCSFTSTYRSCGPLNYKETLGPKKPFEQMMISRQPTFADAGQ